ncbi:MAG: hypothetical protein J4452_02290 [Candidatus Aenigmarchaeota archaeon]|nr:hypothetical protein [Candidatus Aenigmarchaeota archaeon]
MEKSILLTEIRRRVNQAEKRITNIKYLQPVRTLEDTNQIVSKVDEIIDSFMKAIEPWKDLESPWKSAQEDARGYSYIAADKTGISKEWEEAFERLRKIGLDNEVIQSWNTVGYYAAWEVVRNLPNLEVNPGEFLLQLYELGLYPHSFADVNGQEKYIVDFPIKHSRKTVFGCYAHRDGRILWTHELTENCSNLKSILPSNRSRTVNYFFNNAGFMAYKAAILSK